MVATTITTIVIQTHRQVANSKLRGPDPTGANSYLGVVLLQLALFGAIMRRGRYTFDSAPNSAIAFRVCEWEL
jgi:hypothetical protein